MIWEKEKILVTNILSISSKFAKNQLIKGYFYTAHTIPTLNDLGQKAFENIVGKGENAGNQHFLLLPRCFLLYQGHNNHFNYF